MIWIHQAEKTAIRGEKGKVSLCVRSKEERYLHVISSIYLRAFQLPTEKYEHHDLPGEALSHLPLPMPEAPMPMPIPSPQNTNPPCPNATLTAGSAVICTPSASTR